MVVPLFWSSLVKIGYHDNRPVYHDWDPRHLIEPLFCIIGFLYHFWLRYRWNIEWNEDSYSRLRSNSIAGCFVIWSKALELFRFSDLSLHTLYIIPSSSCLRMSNKQILALE